MTPEGLPRRVDVVVIGSGPAGAAAALSLARLGASTMIVDRTVPRPVLGESMPPGTRPLLEHLGLWNEFLSDDHRPSHGNRSSWGSSTPNESDFIRSPYGNGWHIDRNRVDRMLDDAVRRAGVTVVRGTRVHGCGRTPRRSWRLTLQTGGRAWHLEAEFVLDATGRARQIARMLGVQRHTYDRLIGLVGVLCTAADNADPDSFTEIEAVASGWWYSSVLPDGRFLAGYMTDANDVTAKTARSREGWLALVQQTMRLKERVARYRYELDEPIRCVCANSSRLEHVTADGFCASGDAAAAYDPLSSQGILSAVTTGVWAAQAIATAERGGLTIYEERISHLYGQYLARWLGYYSLEARWPNAEFWRYRHRLMEKILRED